jgi:hypothetical protein
LNAGRAFRLNVRHIFEAMTLGKNEACLARIRGTTPTAITIFINIKMQDAINHQSVLHLTVNANANSIRRIKYHNAITSFKLRFSS